MSSKAETLTGRQCQDLKRSVTGAFFCPRRDDHQETDDMPLGSTAYQVALREWIRHCSLRRRRNTTEQSGQTMFSRTHRRLVIAGTTLTIAYIAYRPVASMLREQVIPGDKQSMPLEVAGMLITVALAAFGVVIAILAWLFPRGQ